MNIKKVLVMKKQVRLILVAVIIGASVLSCTKNTVGNNTTLKQSINQSALSLNTAMNTISSSKAYSILTVTDATLKSATITDATYKVYITLDSVKGVYNYKPVNKPDRWGWSLIKYFTKTAANSKMIVNMPLSKVTHPRSMRMMVPADSTLANNFSIAVSDYHNDYNNYWDYDYLLTSQISVDNVVTGDLNITSVVNPKTGIQYASQYSFTGGYTAQYKYNSGDTTISSFTILNGTNVLYQEKLQTVRNDTVRFGREHQYTLTIGNVQIVRKSGTTGVAVYLNNVLQANAIVKIADKDSTNQEDHEVSVLKKRDIQITFDDGTTTTVSALIGNSVTNIKTLFDSLHSVYFAAGIVDWIAYDIYYHRN
jgi:hypothetical protein